MTTPLKPDDHYVLRKLCEELLPWMISGKQVRRQWFVHTALVYSYVVDLAAALAGLGIGAPLVTMINGKTQASAEDVTRFQVGLGLNWFTAGVFALIAWIVLKVVTQRQNVIARALLAREYARSIDMLFAELERALREPDPMPKILLIQKTVDDRVQDAIKNEIWPYQPPMPPDDVIAADLKLAVERYRANNMPKWAAPAAGVLL